MACTVNKVCLISVFDSVPHSCNNLDIFFLLHIVFRLKKFASSSAHVKTSFRVQTVCQKLEAVMEPVVQIS